jgi:serine-type D-Ala-D-Ala carboxypeptidase/endopeptidase (penicillin-binding protein 4)
MVSRRLFLSGAFAGLAQAGFAMPPETSLVPQLRPGGYSPDVVLPAADLIAGAALGGRVSFVVADANSGTVLETENPLRALPPASVTKALTAAYALDRLGPGYRFRTQVVADGRLTNGRLEGDLWLIGGADPVLDTDRLNDLTRALSEAGLREVTGRFMVATGAVPFIHEIDRDQPLQAGYNPAISALSLNFNRVFFEWERGQDGYAVTMDARSPSVRPSVSMTRMQVVDRNAPVYQYSETETQETWSVARGALGREGGRWLPVRLPHLYAAEVFQVLARSRGIVLEAPGVAETAPENTLALAEHVSEPLEAILRGMMRWSTNLTAEIVGLLATQASGETPASLLESATAMSDWMQQRWGINRQSFVDHSGLGDESRMTTREMVRALVGTGANGGLRRLMRDIPMRDAEGNLLPDHPVEVVAKTGTLYFVSTLAGFARTPNGRDLAFAIFCGDLDRRAALDTAVEQRPQGVRGYNRSAKRLQQQLIERWAAVYP